MRGEKVTLIRRVETGDTDPAGAPVTTPVEEQIDDVLVAPGAQANATDATRPDGVTVAYTLYLPRAWAYHSLRGSLVRIDGHEYEVIGDPRPYDGGLTPTRWNLEIEVADTRG